MHTISLGMPLELEENYSQAYTAYCTPGRRKVHTRYTRSCSVVVTVWAHPSTIQHQTPLLTVRDVTVSSGGGGSGWGGDGILNRVDLYVSRRRHKGGEWRGLRCVGSTDAIDARGIGRRRF